MNIVSDFNCVDYAVVGQIFLLLGTLTLGTTVT